jgi:uncharacterized membrane protein
MDAMFWAKAHGAATHFPLALVVCSAVCDFAGVAGGERPFARDLTAVGFWTMLLGALGSIPAVVSGLMMSKGIILGHGALRLHHWFVWPAFTLVIALATWRTLMRGAMTRRAFTAYLCGVGIASGLMLAAGYWGGELMIVR